MRRVEEVLAHGHPHILAKHPTTFEITRETRLTRRGDCVIGVNANKGPRDFSREFKDLCRLDDSNISLELYAGGIVERIQGSGCSTLTFQHPTESVGRKSEYASDRTVMIKADRAARDLNRDLIEALSSSAALRARFIVEI